MGYQLTGRMAEVCSCKSLCPCSVGEDPDGGYCGFNWVFHFDSGHVNGVDVAGLNLGVLGNHRGNVFSAQVTIVAVIDERADEAQQAALVEAFTGKAGGPLADLAGLVKEFIGVTRGRIEFDMDSGTGSFAVQDMFECEVKGFTAPDGTPTTLNNSVIGSVLGSAAYPGKVIAHEVAVNHFGLQFKGRQATQYNFTYDVA